MFLFFHSEQTKKNASYYKGMLFEGLLANYLRKSGYDVELRRKRNSLEYDIFGQNRTTGQEVVGEAKAFEAPIAGQVLSSFVGKLLPLGLVEKKIHGLFLSTSSLTPEADDYFASMSQFEFSCKTGSKLEKAIRLALDLPSDDFFFSKFELTNYKPQSSHLLTVDSGTLVAVISSTLDSITPSFFTLFDKFGNQILDQNLFQKLVENVAALSPLESTTSLTSVSFHEVKPVGRLIPYGVTVGKELTDYRLPAPPEHYIGRRALIEQIILHLTDKKTPSIIQIKSRSGVGKSSTLALLERQLRLREAKVELHDARDIKSAVDVFAVVMRFIGTQVAANDYLELERQIVLFSEQLAGVPAVFIVDQFESTFANSEVFDAYESLALIFNRINSGVCFCLARKNDQLTTYDETKISLERLNDISMPFELGDFTKYEAKELIEKINAHATRKLSTEVLAYVLEFAQGFPWLLKRTMAHIMRLTEGHQKHQPELVASSLKLNDLFDEELEGLEENEKEYLLRIVSRLPSDYRQLHIIFDEDPQLITMLDKFTRARLLRLTGATYDTYNDVFKEYLVYNKLPEFRQTYLYRLYPGGVMKSFHRMVKLKEFSTEDIGNTLKMAKGSVFNTLSQWRYLNLVAHNGKDWSIPQPVLDVVNHGTLGQYLRRQVMSNDVVARLISRIDSQKSIEEVEVSNYLKESFPFVEATGQTWELYANVLKGWLKTLHIIEIQKNRIYRKNIALEDLNFYLGNLTNIAKGEKKKNSIFFPTASWNYIDIVFHRIQDSKSITEREHKKALSDIKNLGRIQDSGLIDASFDDFKSEVIRKFSQAPYSEIWTLLRSEKSAIGLVGTIVGDDLSVETVKWYIKKLVNWGKALEILPLKTYRTKFR